MEKDYNLLGWWIIKDQKIVSPEEYISALKEAYPKNITKNIEGDIELDLGDISLTSNMRGQAYMRVWSNSDEPISRERFDVLGKIASIDGKFKLEECD